MIRRLNVIAGVALAAGIFAGSALAAGGHIKLEPANVDLSDQDALQRGAKLFVNYCLSCHNASYMRYNRLADDLGIPLEVVESNLMFASDKVGDTMKVAMPADLSADWFGKTPPDLSVVARSRGPDWIYNFLQSYYIDESKPTGVNNLVFVGTAMPHVLWELQGLQKLVTHESEDDHGEDSGGSHGEESPTLELVQAGSLNPAEYTRAVRDLTSYLVYMGEPAKLVRYDLGVWVIGFLLVLLVPVYLMKREYWKDVH